MAKQSSVNLDITNNADGFDISGGTTVRKLGITGGDVTIAGSGSATVTFPTTSTTIAGLGITQSFSVIQSFSAGISAAGGTFSSQTRFLAGITVAGGGTFGTDISVNGIRVGKGGGNASENVALGSNALTLNTTGNYNLAIGTGALASVTAGADNVGLGFGALAANTSSNNLGIGSSTLGNNSTGSDNVGVGTNSLPANTTGSRNVAIGRNSLGMNGDDNVGIGAYSLGSMLSVRSFNTAIGSDAGRYRTGGSTLLGATGGIYIGYGAKGSANAQTNEIVIGTSAEALGSNTAVIGATTQTAATIYGVLRLPGGLSAASGITFSGNVSMTSTSSHTGLASFAGGLSASSGVTFSGNVSMTSTSSYTGLASFAAGISAAGATFSAPITSTRMARHTSAAISAQKTADFSPTAAEDGTVFYVNYGGKGSLTITLEGLPVGWRAKFFNIGGGTVFFTSTTGAVWGEGGVNGVQAWLMEAICFSAGNYIVG
jgi:hypothetical protein